MNLYHLVTLGRFAVFDSKGMPLTLSTRKQSALLAYLSMQPNNICGRDVLATTFWGADDETRARHSLSQALYDLKRCLGPQVVRSSGQLVWITKGTITVDASEVLRLAEDRSSEASLAADRLYQGDFLPGMELDQEEFDSWLMTERERVRRAAQRSIGALLSAGPGALDGDEMLRISRSLLKVDPFDERAHCRIMETYARQGLKQMVVTHFNRLAADLDRELDVRPSAQLVSAYESILRETAAPAGPVFRIEDYVFIVEQIPHPVLVTDMHNRIVGWNTQSEQLLGFSKEEMVGRTPAMLHGDSGLAARIIDSALEFGSWTGEIALLSKDGKRCRQRRVVAPLFAPDGKRLGAFGQSVPSHMPA
ncbi:BTAD domain-containing putative transcriptional regulator [Variovorax terrae]|uniref:PAS domain S-box protein n=1 Tax=Variovorax terrae TaxID=2923278 RepID=A0A9X1VXJ9_9BURK|nr:BTAD domain-containing putative transcriptional regulator [Variovorax terrae]MCJ0764904.1 PAS domain S-box protein [Variovorax terrae]